MAPRLVPTRMVVLAVLLLAFVSTHLHQVHANAAAINDASGFAITASSIEKITSDKQLDANQLFAKTWQIKGNAATNVSFVDYIRVRVPGRVFITYAESSASSSSGAVGEVKVSGSSEAIVQVVDVVSNTTAAGPKLVLQTSTTATEGAYLLVEVQLFVKNKLKVVTVKSSADVVVLDNVLYTKREATVKKTGSQRRLSNDKSSGLVVKAEPKTTDAIGRSQQTYYIKPASGVLSDIHNIDLALEVNGSVTLVQMNPDDGDGTYDGFITVTKTSPDQVSGAMDQLKLITSHGSDGEVLKLHSSSTNTTVDNRFNVYVVMLPSVKVNLTSIEGMQVYDFLNISYNDQLAVNANGTGDVFIADQSLTVDVDSVSIYSTGSANIQVDVADISADGALSMYAWGSGNVTYLGPNLGSTARADVRGTGRICFAPKDEPFVSVPTKDKIDQVSYTGKKDHAFECTKMDLPKRVPAKIVVNELATAEGPVGDSSSPSSRTSSAFQGLLSASMFAFVSIVVTMLTAFD